MTSRTEMVGSWRYRASLDDQPARANRMRAVVQWLAVDEITQLGPDIEYTIRPHDSALASRVSNDGIMGLVGNPAQLYPYLASTSVPIACSLAAPGYLPRELAGTLPAQSQFPNQFEPLDLGNVMLHRDPIVLRGRVVKLVAGQLEPQPQPGVAVSIPGVWWTFPPANVDPSTVLEPPNLAALSPGLYHDRATGTDSLWQQTLTPAGGQDKTLLQAAFAGDHTVRISDQIGVTAGTILGFDTAHPTRAEYVVVKSVAGAATLAQPATARLEFRLGLDHEQGSTVHVMTVGSAGSTLAFTRDGVRGERVAFLPALTGLAANTVVQIGGSAGVSPEYQTVSLYSTQSDGNGYYRLPPLSRVASVQLQTPALAQPLVTSPDYTRYENFVDVVIP